MRIGLIMFLSLFISLSAAKAMGSVNDTIRLNEFVIKAAQARLQDRSPMPAQTIKAELLSRQGAQNIADAIRGFSGITLKDYGGLGGLKTVMVRSLGAAHTGVFVDGIPLSDAASGQIDLGRLTTQGLSEVQLHVGQAQEDLSPARFYSSGAVLQLKSSLPADTAIRWSGDAGLKLGSFGLFNPRLSVSHRTRNNSGMRVDASWLQAHGRYPYPQGQEGNAQQRLLRKNTDVQNLNLAFMLERSDQRIGRLRLRGSFYDSQRGLPGAVVLYNPHSTQRLHNQDLLIGSSLFKAQHPNWQWLSTLSFARQWLYYLDPDYHNQAGRLENTYLQHEYYFSQALAWSQSAKLKVSLASDFFIQTLDADLIGFSAPVRYNWLNHVNLQGQYRRFDYQAGLLSTAWLESSELDGRATAQQVLSPSASLSMRITDFDPVIRLRAMYKHVFRLPTFNDLYYQQIGNLNLRPERARQWNLGLMASWEPAARWFLSARGDVFYNQVTDQIIAVPTKNLFVWSVRNVGKVDTQGLELQLDFHYQVRKQLNLSGWANYTFQKALDISQPQSPGFRQQIPYVPRESLSAGYSMQYGKWNLGYTAMFSGYRYVLPENIYANMLPSWWHHDIHFSGDFPFKPYVGYFRAGLQNLTDSQYEIIRSFPMPGRSFYLSLGLKF